MSAGCLRPVWTQYNRLKQLTLWRDLRVRSLFIIATCLVAFGCGVDQRPDNSIPASIRVAVTPNQAPENLKVRHGPLLDYLQDATGIDFELVIPSDYEELRRQFESGSVDLAWLGGLTFVQAEENGYTVPLVLRDIDIHFTSCYLVRAGNTRTRVDDFKEARFSFGPELSTSGHLMPRYFLTKQGDVPEDFFGSVRYSSGHDQTAIWVADGTVDLGVANCIILQSLLADGRVSSEDIRILDTTPPYSDYLWVARTSLNAATRAIILDAFLALDPTVPLHREVLRLQGANAYLPAGSGDLDIVRAAALQAGLLAGEESR